MGASPPPSGWRQRWQRWRARRASGQGWPVWVDRERLQALEAAEERLAQLERLSAVGVFDIDHVQDRVYCSTTQRRIFGLPDDEVLSLQTLIDCAAPEDRPRVEQAMRRAGEPDSRREATDELRLVHRDGSRHWMMARLATRYGSDGAPRRTVGVASDISERKQAQAVLEAEEARLRFVDQMHAATSSVVDAQDIMNVVTQQLGRHLGADRCGYTVLDDDEDGFTVMAVYEPGAKVSVQGRHRLNDYGPEIAGALRAGRRLVFRDTQREFAGQPVAAVWAAVDVGAMVVCPLVKEGRLRATMAVDSRLPRDWTAAEVDLIDEVVRRAAANVHRAKAEASLRAALQDKEVLIKEIYHRVKNNLQVVSSLLNLHGKVASDATARTLLRETANRVHSMALVHEQLYRRGDLSSIQLVDYARQLVQHLQDGHRDVAPGVQVRLDLADVQLGIETAIPLGLIINELLSNAFKHAFVGREQGEIWLTLQRSDDGALQLQIGDDGPGLPLESAAAAAAAGTRPRGLGMQLVQGLSSQLGGHATVHRQPGPGLRFELRFVPEDGETRRLNAHRTP